MTSLSFPVVMTAIKGRKEDISLVTAHGKSAITIWLTIKC
jgi:hypothetical protein